MHEQTGELSWGFARKLRDGVPKASFIAFTGTPIKKTDAKTRAVFVHYISIYDIQRAVVDQASFDAPCPHTMYADKPMRGHGLMQAIARVNRVFRAGQEHILQQDDGNRRWLQVVSELARALALCAASDAATAIRDDVSFFQPCRPRSEQAEQRQPHNESAVIAMGDDQLKVIAAELVTQVRTRA